MLDLDIDSVEAGNRHERRVAGSGRAGTKNTDRLTGTIADIMGMTGWTRSRTYLNLQEGKIHALKDGKRTLILVDSVRRYIASLPAAEFGSGRAAV